MSDKYDTKIAYSRITMESLRAIHDSFEEALKTENRDDVFARLLSGSIEQAYKAFWAYVNTHWACSKNFDVGSKEIAINETEFQHVFHLSMNTVLLQHVQREMLHLDSQLLKDVEDAGNTESSLDKNDIEGIVFDAISSSVGEVLDNMKAAYDVADSAKQAAMRRTRHGTLSWNALRQLAGLNRTPAELWATFLRLQHDDWDFSADGRPNTEAQSCLTVQAIEACTDALRKCVPLPPALARHYPRHEFSVGATVDLPTLKPIAPPLRLDDISIKLPADQYAMKTAINSITLPGDSDDDDDK